MRFFLFNLAALRFPQPEFEVDYNQPPTTAPLPDPGFMQYLDTFLLLTALSLASYFIVKKRSRKWAFGLMLACLAYFGFVRAGCICPIGSVQNVTFALFEQSYALPITVLAFFLLPIIFSLFFGRTFCAAVCPLGAIQDVVVLKPMRLPATLSRALSIIPYIYLGAAVLLAATGSAFIICRIDPFVAFFRMSGELSMVIFGAIVLIIGVFIARPYCRFLCPYGVVLSWSSRFSKHHMTITPAECIQCRLCEDSCPFDAIRQPVPTVGPEKKENAKKRLLITILVTPIIIAGSAWGGSQLHPALAGLNNTVILAQQIAAEENGATKETTLRSEAFREGGQSIADLYKEASAISENIRVGCWILGIFIGLTISFKLIYFSIRRTRQDYEPDRGECLSCGRCFSYCPVKADDKDE